MSPCGRHTVGAGVTVADGYTSPNLVNCVHNGLAHLCRLVSSRAAGRVGAEAADLTCVKISTFVLGENGNYPRCEIFFSKHIEICML